MISSYLSLKNLQESLEVYIETFKDPDNHEDFGYKLCCQDFVLDLIGILDLLWPLVVLMLQPEHRVFTYATCPTPAVAKTPTQAGHVAPRFWVPHGAVERGRSGKGCFVYKRVNSNELPVKDACIVHLELKQFGYKYFLWRLPKSYILWKAE